MLDGREFQSSTTLCDKKNLRTFYPAWFLEQVQMIPHVLCVFGANFKQLISVDVLFPCEYFI